MNATDELKRLLDERGEDYVSDQHSATWAYYTDPHTATESMDGTLIVTGLTPEQAIAATLGDADYERRMDELLCRLTNGKWSKSRSYTVDFMVACVDEAYEEAYAEDAETLGGGECDYPEHDGRYECPDCGNVVYYDELYGGGWTIYVEDYQIPFNHCPNCGKAVKR